MKTRKTNHLPMSDSMFLNTTEYDAYFGRTVFESNSAKLTFPILEHRPDAPAGCGDQISFEPVCFKLVGFSHPQRNPNDPVWARFSFNITIHPNGFRVDAFHRSSGLIDNERIRMLLTMPKRVTNPKAREVSDANHLKRDYKVTSEDGTEDFVLFLRQNKTITDDFTCGLRWIAPGHEELMPVRYNGASHSHPNRLEGNTIEFVPHIQRATERYLQANLKSEGFAEVATKYTTLSGALHELVHDLHITGLETKPDHPKLF